MEGLECLMFLRSGRLLVTQLLIVLTHNEINPKELIK